VAIDDGMEYMDLVELNVVVDEEQKSELSKRKIKEFSFYCLANNRESFRQPLSGLRL